MDSKQLKRRELILEGNLWKVILLLAVPVVINNGINAMYSLIDTYFVAGIGSTELAAVGFVGPLTSIVTNLSTGLTIGGTTLIAREIGRKEYDKGKNIAMQLLIVAMLIAGVITAIAFVFSKEILYAASATDAIIDAADLYFKMTVLSTPFVFFNAAYIAIKRADGDTVKTMQVNMVGMGLKTILTYIMIYPLGMGIKGLALSTIIGTGVVSAYGMYDLFCKESMLRLSFKKPKLTWQVIGALLIIGIPIIIEKTSLSISNILMNKYVIGYGEGVLVAFTVTNRINGMFFGAVSGFGIGLSPIISQNLAVKHKERVKKAISRTYILGIGVAILTSILVLLYKTPIASHFSNGDADVLYHTVNAISVYSISVIPWAIFQVTNGIFQGTGHTRYNMIISIFRIYAFRIPIVLFFMYFTNMQEYSIWYAMLISNILTAGVALVLYYMKRNTLESAIQEITYEEDTQGTEQGREGTEAEQAIQGEVAEVYLAEQEAYAEVHRDDKVKDGA